MPSSTKTLNAYVVKPYFYLNAWVIGGRHRHHRTRDHFGADSDLYITLDEPLGQWAAGTPVKYVLADLYDRIVRLTSYVHQIRVMKLDAYVLAPSSTSGLDSGTNLGVKWLDAVVKATPSASFTLRALVGTGGSFTLDAYVGGSGVFYLNAYVV